MSTTGKRIADFFLAVLAVLGGIVSLMTLYPRVTVSISFDTKTPLSSSFLVSNDGNLPVYSVQVSCMLGDIIGAAVPTDANKDKPLEVEGILTSIPTITLEPGAKESVPFSDCFYMPPGVLGSAHVGLRVTYRPLLWPSNRNFTQEFYAKSTGNDNFIWYSVPYLK